MEWISYDGLSRLAFRFLEHLDGFSSAYEVEVTLEGSGFLGKIKTGIESQALLALADDLALLETPLLDSAAGSAVTAGEAVTASLQAIHSSELVLVFSRSKMQPKMGSKEYLFLDVRIARPGTSQLAGGMPLTRALRMCFVMKASADEICDDLMSWIEQY